jgi:hypothetical protein
LLRSWLTFDLSARRNSKSEFRNLFMQPEISRRCLSCGASVRAEALFCPECGQSLSARHDDPEPNTAEKASPPAAEQNVEQHELGIEQNVAQNVVQEAQTAELNTLGPEAQSTSIEGDSFAAVIKQKQASTPVKAFATAGTKSRKSSATKFAAKTTPQLPSSGHERPGSKAREKLHRASTAAR